MDLQKALAICLLSFFSATLVVLIARTLDNQAAIRLEPQLARIADQLEAIQAGGTFAPAAASGRNSAVDDGLIVYYFYSNTRCPTCRAIESQTEEAIQSNFAAQLESGDVVWQRLNYEEDRNAGLMQKFEISMPVVVLVQMKDGQTADWKRLDQVWGLVGKKPKFTEFIRDEVTAMLAETEPETGTANVIEDDTSTADIPLP